MPTTRAFLPKVPRPLAAALLFVPLLALAGCSDDDEVVTRFTPTLVAATAADTLAPGLPLDVKVHWRSGNTCQRFEGFSFNAVDDTSFVLVAVAADARDKNSACENVSSVQETNFRINNPPQQRFRVQVIGAAEVFELTVVGGTAAAQIERHWVRVRNAVGGGDVEGATAHVIAAATGDTLATLTTAADGTAETALPCVAGGRAYLLDVTGASGRRSLLEFRAKPAVCGIPERTSIRL